MGNDNTACSNDSSSAVSVTVRETYEQLLADTRIQNALELIRKDNEQTLQDQIQITEIPAPSFKERQRGEDFKRRLEAVGVQDVQFDAEGNVFGFRPGLGNGPVLVVSSHLDTVFPEGTDVFVKEKNGKYYAPGIADDGRGLAVLLSLARILNETQIQSIGDVIFCATVGEEGLGDLRGVKAFFQGDQHVDGFISIEPGDPTRTTYLATGSRRYRVTYQGPGGHSFGAFGTPSAIHALGRAIALISDLDVPKEPKTTFTVGEIRGGTSVNTIAATASMMLDMRSNDETELAKLEQRVLDILHRAVDLENECWQRRDIQVNIELVGDRPAGTQASDAVIVQAAMAASASMGHQPALDGPSSTDSNVPIHLGIPAVTLGGGGNYGGIHTLDEWFDPTDAYLGVQKVFLTMIGLVGLVDRVQPLLERRV